MIDIVEELRGLQTGAAWVCGQTAATLEDAADEIERLREAQAAIHALSQRPPGGWLPGEHFQALNKIAALAAPKGTGHE